MDDRAQKVSAVIESLERDLELLCLTGVEDKLQENVRPTLELLRNAGIKVTYHKITSIVLEKMCACMWNQGVNHW